MTNHDSIVEVAEQLYERGKQEQPNIDLSRADFFHYAIPALQAEAGACSLPATIDGFCAGDVYLAYACAHGVKEALHLFAAQLSDAVPQILRKAFNAQLDEQRCADIVQQISQRLLTADPGASPKIATYRGRSRLTTWLHATVYNEAKAELEKINRLRVGQNKLAQATPSLAETMMAQPSPELLAMRAQGLHILKSAFEVALASLLDKQRELLAGRHAYGFTLAKLGAFYNVDHTTIKRRLETIHKNLYAQMELHVRAQLNLTTSEFRSLFRSMFSKFQPDLAQLEPHGEHNNCDAIPSNI